MATAYHPFHQMDHHYALQPTLSIDSRRSGFFEDDDSVLDDGILGNDLLDTNMDARRTVDANAIFSPAADGWDFDHDMIGAGPADDAAAATFEHSSGTNNPFVKLEPAQHAFAQPHNWSNNSGACTPYDNNFATTFEDATYLAPAMPANGPPPFGEKSHIPPNAVFSAPPPVNAWDQPADHSEQPLTKRMRPHSPAPRAHSPLNVIRRDGIRKKNARFDIPAERTLSNIDQLIARSQDENEIKELKQQKRLLRNRQAALDSRQRKKQHTERLEEEKKIHSAVIQELEEKISAMSMENEQMAQRYSEAAREREFFQHKANTLHIEKEELVRAHTLETGDLRKKNSYLQDQLQKLQDALDRMPTSAQNDGAAAYTDPFDFESDFNIDNCWDSPMSMVDVQPVKAEKPAAVSDVDKPATGLLLVLLLCGAFVASSKSAIPSLPPLPKQVQNAGASVLQNLFQDAGVSEASRVDTAGPSSVSDAWAVSKSDVPQMVGLDSTMNMLNSFDTKPSMEQQHEQFMQLSAAEYNEVTSNNFLREPEPVDLRGRRRIQEGLASMRKSGAAEVYTRSLLWDKVDAEVVRRFAAFARQAQAQQAGSNDEASGAACHS